MSCIICTWWEILAKLSCVGNREPVLLSQQIQSYESRLGLVMLSRQECIDVMLSRQECIDRTQTRQRPLLMWYQLSCHTHTIQQHNMWYQLSCHTCDTNSLVIQRGRGHFSCDTNSHVIPTLKRVGNESCPTCHTCDTCMTCDTSLLIPESCPTCHTCDTSNESCPTCHTCDTSEWVMSHMSYMWYLKW